MNTVRSFLFLLSFEDSKDDPSNKDNEYNFIYYNSTIYQLLYLFIALHN